ncbi:diacylglycerol/lipid kinase family protein [Desertivirga arenae]|uniref:diacylglycerol/lipid kinase family protein n=1 Tax=Desertivirga arenae TaxID=2810309 RepID=UPI001A95E56C
MLKKKILFIINPISGGKNKRNFQSLADKILDPELYDPQFEFSQRAGHAFTLAERASSEGVDVIVAVGGDGTINEVASAVEGTNSIMGIIPFGSGNGLARSLNVSLKTDRALKALNRFKIEVIDTAELAGYKFFNMGGVGFDARISYQFTTLPKRGFKGYVKTTFNEILNYKAKKYLIEIDGKRMERDAFMISIANSSQYGNNAYISPTASLKDGLLDLCIVKPFPLYHFPVMVYHLFSKTSEKSRYVEIIKGKNIRIKTTNVDTPEVIHLDGEPRRVNGDILANIKPLSLKVLH